MQTRVVAALLVVLLLPAIDTATVRASDDVAALLRQRAETANHTWLRWPTFPDYQHHFIRLYETIEWRPLWIRDGRPTPQALEVIDSFRQADARGLRSADYDPDRLAAEADALDSDNATHLALFEAALSVAAMRYVSASYVGRVNPHSVGFGFDVEPKKLDLVALLIELSTSADPKGRLAGLDPQFPMFARLRAALPRMRQLAGTVAPPSLLPPAATPLRPGESGAVVAELRRYLIDLGLLPADVPGAEPQTYDAALVDAVKRFQDLHGLAADGVIGVATWRALRVPLSARVRQIELAMERLRWLPPQLGGRFLIVNLPEFRLYGFEPGQPEPRLVMDVVVGSAARRHATPIMHADMQHVVFRPYWTVPPGIARKEILPKVRQDSGYLARNDMEIVNRKVRQRPGPRNALGLVKFLFPNEFHVYMHDTPQKALFSRMQRDFSHGCIRVADPPALAEFVLGWDRDRIVDAMQNGRNNRWVEVREPIPVYLFYSTVLVDTAQRVFFFDDLYGHDAQLSVLLERGYPYPP